MKTSITTAGEAMPARPTSEYYAAWEKCRRLGKELSQALAETGDEEFAFIQPAGKQCAVSFGGLSEDSRSVLEYPVTTVDRLSTRLSFTAMRDGKELPKYTGEQMPRCFWNVQPTGNYGADSALGQKLALEYLDFEAADRGGPGHLQMIVNDMPRPIGGIEVGFLTLVSYAAAAGRHEAQRVSSFWNGENA